MKFECTKYKKVGFLMVNSGKIDITDPCYNRDVWCRMNNITVKPGKYKCYVSVLKGKMAKEWGKRIVSMMIVHENADLSEPLGLDEIGSVGVDAGLMSIAESGVKPDYSDAEWQNACFQLDELEKEALQGTRSGIDAFVTPKFSTGKRKKKQFWASSGFGDGVYGVYAVDSHNQGAREFVPDAVQVEFIEPFED